MKKLLFAVLTAVVAMNALAQDKPAALALTPQEMNWKSSGNMSLAGMEQAVLLGDPSKPGPYTLRLKFPAGYKLAPHGHPDSREITILSGVWYTAYGTAFDESQLKALPAGSWYTEPAGLPHYVLVKEPTVIQVSGHGPSGRHFVDANHSHK